MNRALTRLFPIAVLAGLLSAAQPAAAQAPDVPAPASTPSPIGARKFMPFGGRIWVGGTAGAGAVQDVGGVYGGEVAYDLTDRLQLFGEGLWMENVVTRRRLDYAHAVVNFLEGWQGKDARGEVVVPAGYGAAGLRVMLFETGPARVYASVSAGGARVAVQPTFWLAGADITNVISRYGVDLGTDLTGEITAAAFSGGAGIRWPRGRWYLDGGIRVTSIRTPGQPTNIARANASVGMKF
jgi:hypothetical protein